MSETLLDRLTGIVAKAFVAAGYAEEYGRVEVSNRPDLGQFQCNGALAAARQYRQNPLQIAEKVRDAAAGDPAFSTVTVARPGFLNLTLEDGWLARQVAAQQADGALGCGGLVEPERVMIDFGGANVAKPLHVGHLRSAIIGEALKRLGRFVGHEVIGDVHLGDWGLQMGMLIHELSLRRPDLPYFDEGAGPFPSASPVTVEDLEELYPTASGKAKADEAYAEAARRATAELQAGRPGYRALWRHFVDVSIRDLEADYRSLDVTFDLWLGESDAHEDAVRLVADLEASGQAVRSQGALVVEVEQPDDAAPMPPLLLQKSDGAFLYGTTDLATIAQRMRLHHPSLILYVVDARQATHLEQVYRAARKVGLVPDAVGLEHIAFGTMNGSDGKPFRTRAGGTMKLKDLIALINEHATRRIEQLEDADTFGADEKTAIARVVGIATLKFADLSNHRTRDYVFDPERFSSFEGRTGPYLLYSAVRAASILRKAEERGIAVGALAPEAYEAARAMLLTLADFPDTVLGAWRLRAPNILCDFAYRLASGFNQFYHEHPILREEDDARRGAYLWLTRAVLSTLGRVLDLLGMEVPDRM